MVERHTSVKDQLPRIRSSAGRQEHGGPIEPGGYVRDGYQSLLSGIGVLGRDKGPISATYMVREMTRQQCDAAYRADWIARKAIDIIPHDCTRMWRTWQAEKKELSEIEKGEKKHKLQQKINLAMRFGRCHGGGALIMGTKDGAVEQPLVPEKIGKDGLLYVHAVPKDFVSSGPLILDWTSDWFGQPEYYIPRQDMPGLATNIKIHPSRVLRFYGQERLDLFNTGTDMWSDSILLAIDDAIKSAGLTSAAIAHLISEAKVDVINVPGLTDMLSSREGESKLTKRFAIANTMKSVINTIVLDGEEEWNRLEMNFAGMPDIILVYLMIASGAVDIPAVRFLSQSPKGLNATGESDIRNHYDMIKAKQSNELQPAINPLDEIFIRSTLGSRPEELFYSWNSLWQKTDVEEADLNKKKADTFKIDVDSGMINPDALRRVRINQLIEDEVYPGLEAAIDEFGEEPPEPEVDPTALAIQRMKVGIKPEGKGFLPQPPQPKQLPAPARAAPRTAKDALRVGDALPKPLYVYRELEPASIAKVKAWALGQGLTEIVEDMHVIIIYSRSPVDWMLMGVDDFWGGDDDTFKVKPGGPRVISKFGGAIVLEFSSRRLKYRHEEMVAKGASHDYEEYNCHLTLTYASGIDISAIEPFKGELRFGPEIFKEAKPFDPDADYEDED